MVILTLVICPKLLITTSNSAPEPSPLILKLGATLYPRPGLVILTLEILPLVITGVTWKIVKPSPLAPLPQERGTRK